MKEIEGAGVALVTPFHEDGKVDYATLERLIDYQIESGIDYLVSLGTTGEMATLTPEERTEIWNFTSKSVNKRIPLVAGIGGNNTAETTRQIQQFDTLDYCAILSVSPYYNKPTQEGIYQHYKALCQASPLPLILYNVPGRTGGNISAQTSVRLARDFSQIVATKEASGNFSQFSEILRDAPEDFMLISGDDPVTLPMMALGAAGIISVVGNAYPEKVSTLTRLCRANNYVDARKIHQELLHLIDLCFTEGNPAGVKYMLEKKGFGTAHLRLPLTPISDATKKTIDAAMEKLV